MKIKLKDSINSELLAVGLRPDDEISSADVNQTTGAVQFTRWHNGSSYDCVVWPEDYEILDKPANIQTSGSVLPELPQSMILPVAEITEALDAMHWCFSPYLDYSDLSEKPWIENLIKSYNAIASSLPSPWDLQYEPVDY